MTIHNQLKLIPLSEIKINRTKRQRSKLTPASVFSLACSIARDGLLQNIGVNADTMEIVFGERRFTALCLIQDVFQANVQALEIGDLTESQKQTLFALTCIHKEYESWTKIPVRFIKNISKLKYSAIEFIENVSREDLPWQDRAAAAFSIHKEALTALRQRNADRSENQPLERWADQQTADLLGITRSYFTQLVAPLRELASASNDTKKKVKEALDPEDRWVEV